MNKKRRAKKGQKKQGKVKIPLPFELAVEGLLAVKPVPKKSRQKP
jgi:hypothetical protein